MKEFKVVEIIDANTIRVIPSWRFKEPWDEAPTCGNLVKLLNFEEVPSSNQVAKDRLETLLLNQRVMLFSPELVIANKPNDGNIVASKVMLDERDVVRFFPDFKRPVRASWWAALGF